MSTTAVGIDLGTTNSVVALSQGGKPRVLSTEDGGVLIPSVVSFHPGGQTLVGAAARARRAVDPQNTVFSVKRLLGRPFNSEEVRRARARFPFQLREGADAAIHVQTRGGNHSLPEISALILREIRRVAEVALGAPVSRAVVTVPANFNELQRTATKLAGQIADLEVIRILNEPTAAALAYGYGRGTRERIAVYDFGGGTFDVTLLELSGNVFEVLSTAGDTFLGGDDVDLALTENLADALVSSLRVDARQDPRAYELLRGAAEQAKIDLSESDVATIRIPEVAYGPGGRALEFRTRISRPEIERLASPFVERTLEVCAEALKLAGIAPQECQTVILVGGSSRMPAVRRRVAEFFGREPLTSLPPEQVVAMGASILAEALTGPRRRVTGSHTAPPGPSSGAGSVGGTATGGAGPAVSPGRASGLSSAGAPLPSSPPVGARPSPAPAGSTTAPMPAATGAHPAGRPTSAGTVGAPEPRERISTYRGPAAPPAQPAPPPAAPAVAPRTPTGAPPRNEGSVSGARLPPPGALNLPLDATGSGARRPPPGALAPQPDLDDPLGASGAPAGAGPYPNWLNAPGGQYSPLAPPPAAPGAPRAPISELTWESPRFKSERPASVRPDALDDPFEDSPTAVGAPAVAPANIPGPPAPPAFPPPALAPPASPLTAGPRPPPVPHPGMRTATMPTVAEPPAAVPAPPRITNPMPVAAPPPAPPQAFRAEPSVSRRLPTPPPSAPTGAAAPVRFSSRPPAPLLLDVTPHSLGIETVGGLCEVVIRRNATIPVEQTREFATTYDGQEEVRIRIAQGESRRFGENQPLGELLLSGITRAPRGDVKVAVTFELDANGTLNVRACEVATGRQTQTRVSLLTMPSAADAAGMAQRQRGAV